MRKMVDKGQAWFCTRRWQEGEQGTEADIHAGRVHHFDSAREAIAYLHRRAKTRPPVVGDREVKC